jgi:uncharacterized membrane protein
VPLGYVHCSYRRDVAATNWLLFFHLLGAFALLAGAAVAATLKTAAIRSERPSEILVLLRLTRVGVALVGIGAVLTLVLGIGLAQHLGYGLSPLWIQASLGLWLGAMALGGLGGGTARRSRTLAERLATDGDEPSEELHALLAHSPTRWASYASTLMILAVVVLMVWRPT